MDLLLWLTIGFIIIGFVALISKKKSMESKVDFIKANIECEESSTIARSVAWWVWCTTVWAIVGIFLVVWCFHNYFG
ncbi:MULTISPECIES: hypothetical protein [Bacillaceae]|uniref:Uncharacterized protein n=1 Tax=Evansella alkalicola TaxID=745819 RepID=A0ABS6JSZ5_9BACI|nr:MULTISPECIES: hypothetical protein [Bacillaceae]MBU9721684.1 hypothetical protein [Bacillus alkalicola]